MFGKIVECDRTGGYPMYRGKFWQRRERDRGKVERKFKWHKERNYETIMFVEAKPNEQLAKLCRKALQEAKLDTPLLNEQESH